MQKPRLSSLTEIHWEGKGTISLYLKGHSSWLIWDWGEDSYPLWRAGLGKRILPSQGEIGWAVDTIFNLQQEWRESKADEVDQSLLLAMLNHVYLSKCMTRHEKNVIKKWFLAAPIQQRNLTKYEALNAIKQFHSSLDWKLQVGMAWIQKFSSESQREMLLFPKPPKWLK